MLKDILVEIAEPLRLRMFRYKWRKNNKHNFTTAENRFPIDRVIIGNATYGPINLQHIQNPESQLIVKNYCSIAEGVKFLLGGEHNYRHLSTYPFKRMICGEAVEAESKGSIVVCDDVWIGLDSTILSGVILGQGCVIGAGSIVTRSIPPYAIYAGGEIKKYRFSSDTINKLLQVDFNKLNSPIIKENLDIFYTKDINSFFNSEVYKLMLK